MDTPQSHDVEDAVAECNRARHLLDTAEEWADVADAALALMRAQRRLAEIIEACKV